MNNLLERFGLQENLFDHIKDMVVYGDAFFQVVDLDEEVDKLLPRESEKSDDLKERNRKTAEEKSSAPPALTEEWNALAKNKLTPQGGGGRRSAELRRQVPLRGVLAGGQRVRGGRGEAGPQAEHAPKPRGGGGPPGQRRVRQAPGHEQEDGGQPRQRRAAGAGLPPGRQADGGGTTAWGTTTSTSRTASSSASAATRACAWREASSRSTAAGRRIGTAACTWTTSTSSAPPWRASWRARWIARSWRATPSSRSWWWRF